MAIKACLAEFTIEGLRGVPLLMHNGRLANPLDPATKALKAATSRKKKTEEDILDIMRLEWEGGMYFDQATGPVIPAENIQSAITDGCKRNKNGRLAKAGVYVMDDHMPLEYDGPRDMDGMYADKRFVSVMRVKIQGKAVQRTRPRFMGWSCSGTLQIMADVLDPEEVRQGLEAAGLFCGLGDYKPKYGRFTVAKFSVVQL